MTDRRPADQDIPRAKRLKTNTDLDPASNPYLRHMYPDTNEGDSRNGYINQNGSTYSDQSSSPLTKFQRHKTTAKQADEAEKGPYNPFNGKPLSSTYFSILKTRKDLPVHKQRYAINSFCDSELC